MQNSATLRHAGDFVSLHNGLNSVPDYLGESMVLQGRDDILDIAVGAGTWTGAKLQVWGRRPDRTETPLALGTDIALVDSTGETIRFSFPVGQFGDFRVVARAIASGAVPIIITSANSGRAAPSPFNRSFAA